MAISLGVATPTGVTAGDGSSSNGDLTINLPTSWAVGQLALIVLYIDANATYPAVASTPTGWTAVTGSPFYTGPTLGRLYLWWRFLQSGDSSPITTISGSTTNYVNSAAMATFNNVNATTPVEVVGTHDQGTGTPMGAASIDTLTDGAWALGCCGRSDNEDASNQTFGGSATGVAEIFDSGTAAGSDGQVCLYYKVITSHGTVGAGSADTSVSDPWVSVLIALKPATITFSPCWACGCNALLGNTP